MLDAELAGRSGDNRGARAMAHVNQAERNFPQTAFYVFATALMAAAVTVIVALSSARSHPARSDLGTDPDQPRAGAGRPPVGARAQAAERLRRSSHRVRPRLGEAAPTAEPLLTRSATLARPRDDPTAGLFVVVFRIDQPPLPMNQRRRKRRCRHSSTQRSQSVRNRTSASSVSDPTRGTRHTLRGSHDARSH